MKFLRLALWGILVIALGFGILLFVQRLTVQELTRATHPSTQEAICLMWKPRLFQGNGACDLELQNSRGKVVDSIRLGTVDAGFEALQQFGQIEFQGEEVLVSSRRSGETVRRLAVRGGRFETGK